MTTGEKITQERNKLNLTQQQFADEMGVTRQAVSRWEGDVSFPETDKLIKMSEMFGCSIDYLVKYNSNGKEGEQPSEKEERGNTDRRGPQSYFIPLKWSFEYKSEKTVFGMPLVHVNIGLGKVASGFFSVGLVSKGVFSAGLLSMGLFSFGLLSIGLLSFGAFSLGGISLGAIALGLLALGGIALGLIAFGGLALGLFSCGGCSTGLFAAGGYADGYFVAVGDYAKGQIAFGQTTIIGSKLSVSKETFAEQREAAWKLMEDMPAIWQGFVKCIKSFAQSFMLRN